MKHLVIATMLALGLAACGGGGGGDETAAPAPDTRASSFEAPSASTTAPLPPATGETLPADLLPPG